MTVRGIAFDLEGTVVDVEAAHHQAHFKTAAEVGVELDLDSALASVPHFIGGPEEQIYAEILDLSPRAAELSVAGLVQRKSWWYEHYLETMEIKPRPGFLAIFEQCRELGIMVTIGSLTPENQAKVLLEHSGLREAFADSNIVLREDVEKPKPAPDVFLRTAAIMEIDPQDQVVFEDSPRGVQAAVAAGSRAIGMPVYNRVETVSALVQEGVIRVFIDWREICFAALIENLNNQGSA